MYESSDFNSNEFEHLAAELPENLESHCEIMAQLLHVTLFWIMKVFQKIYKQFNDLDLMDEAI